jgi:hypothetical protein
MIAPLAGVALLAAAGATSCRTGPERLPRCGEPPSGIRRLESYWDVQLPATYWLDMVFKENEWQPAESLPMPPHHATHLELIHGTVLRALSVHQTERLRFTVEITSRDVQPVAGRREWRATYVARVVGVCAPRAGPIEPAAFSSPSPKVVAVSAL